MLTSQQLVFYACFLFVLGACVGSFLNVVIWRLPHRGTLVTHLGKTARLTLSWPPSHCPLCDKPIPFYLNVPILGWLFLRGRCARCHAPIALRYPLVELATALLFAAVFLAYFAGAWNPAIGSFPEDTPVLALHLFLITALLAASAIDADWFIIPLEIPMLLALVGLIAAPLIDRPAIPTIDVTGHWAWPTIGGTAGLLLSLLLLHLKWIPRSFAELEPRQQEKLPEHQKKSTKKTPSAQELPPNPSPVNQQTPITPPPALTRQWPSLISALVLIALPAVLWFSVSPKAGMLTGVLAGVLAFLLGVLPRDASAPDVTAEVVEEISVPQARREVLKEFTFLFFPIAGALLAASLPSLDVPPSFAAPLSRLLGAMLGFLAGGAIVWFTRIFGTLLFGKEAMGLGDIHLMYAVGAIIGAPLVILTFLVFAPVLGLLWALVLISLRKPNVLPYGPWLSVGAILALFLGNPLLQWYLNKMLGVPLIPAGSL